MIETNVTEKTRPVSLWITVIRALLGIILIWKGIVFIQDTTFLQALIAETGVGVFSKNSEALAFVVAYLSLLCGIFIFSGLWTKASAIVQIPVLIVAIFFVNAKGLSTSGFELVLSIITLILLIFFVFKGSGAVSADEFYRSYYKAGTEDGQTKKFFE